jgi:glyoxylase-like metal-dependent hydrolase (beta-lactamase superfamily II)
MMFRRIVYLLVLIIYLFSKPALTQHEPSTASGVTVSKINDHLYQLTCAGGTPVNLILSTGPDGMLLVDAGRASTVDQLIAALDTLGNGPVRYIISTHSDNDHNGGNRAFENGTTLIAHENTAQRLSGAYFELPPLPGRRVPDLRVTDDFSMIFNGETIQFIHVPLAHTDGDLMAFFSESRVLYLSDLLLADLIAFVHPDFGGDALNYVENLKAILDTLPADITLIPGHGPNYTLEQLREYYKMLEFTSERVRDGRLRGETAEDVLSDDRLNQWADWNGNIMTTHMKTWIPDLFQSFSDSEDGPLVSVCGPMTRLLLDEGVEAAATWYLRIRQESPAGYVYGVNELNNLGYHLLWRNRLDDAIEIFRLNIEAYPDNANTYDSMGEAYMTRGDKELAITYYEKSLELDPSNQNACAMLAQLKGSN